MAKKKQHGGKRKGSGRPIGTAKKEHTVVMRVPLSKVEAVRELLSKD